MSAYPVTSTFPYRCLDLLPQSSCPFTLSSRPAPAVIAACPRCHRALPPPSSRPAPAVIATCPRCHRGLPPPSSRPSPCCHLDRRERSQTGLGIGSGKAKTRFLAPLRNDSGGIIKSFSLSGTLCALTTSVASPYPRRHRYLPPPSSRPAPAVIATYPRCRRGLPPPSSLPAPAVISPCPRCHRDLPPLSSRPAPAVISTAGRDLKQGLE